METERTGTQDIENSLKKILEYIGDNPEREGLIDTPKRIRKSWDRLFGGYRQNPKDILTATFTDGTCNEMVILKDIEFYSTCEHHFLPFVGKISIGYIPGGKVVGVSKLARLVEIYARRLQIQERMTGQIADDIMQYIGAQGCMVVCEAQHLCMVSRGVEKQQSKMITSAVRGVFFNQREIRDEFLSLIKNN
ncbi:MAG: GTP cyclohydrolase I FolE [Prevotellaceae bacterium]|jgi:GTP cyclohydrolase I|nr:GTP cyclohydrolase I FolE [Prevotellaceae bacterium]